MKNLFKPLILVFAIIIIFASVGIPVGAQGGIGDGSTSQVGDQTLQGAGTNVAIPGGPGFIMIHPTALIPIFSTMEYAFGYGGFLYNPGDNNTAYEAAVNLPDGAKITKVVVYYVDNSSTDNFWVKLVAISMDDSSLPNLAHLETSGAEGTNRVIEDTTITPDTIDNQSYAYWIEAYIPGSQGTSLKIRGIRIDYSYPVSLPLIKR